MASAEQHTATSAQDAIWPMVLVVLVLWLVTRIGYTIDDHHVRVVLMRLTLRKIALTDIESVDTRVTMWNEHWYNTLWPRRRTVRIRRKTGLIRDFVITPIDRDAFIAELRGRLSGIQRNVT